jgi:hypothetical protein
MDIVIQDIAGGRAEVGFKTLEIAAIYLVRHVAALRLDWMAPMKSAPAGSRSVSMAARCRRLRSKRCLERH